MVQKYPVVLATHVTGTSKSTCLRTSFYTKQAAHAVNGSWQPST